MFSKSMSSKSVSGKSVSGKSVSSRSVTRRDILKSLTMGVMAGSVLRVIPAQAAEYAHHLVQGRFLVAP